MIIVKYTKAQYQAKVTELEGFYQQLSVHLTKMEELKSKMFDFWNDESAQKTGQILALEIRSVRSAMDRTADSIAFFKSTIDKLDGANISVMGILSDVLGLLGTGE